MITRVDGVEGYEIQKVTKPNGQVLRYQVVALPAGNADAVKVFVNLKSARAAIGKGNNGRIANVN